MLSMKNPGKWLVLAMITAGIAARLAFFGDLKSSVIIADTPSYIDSSRVRLTSWEAFTSYRPFTTNLIYRIFTPQDGYKYRPIAEGLTTTTHRRRFQDFQNIAVLQSILSIIGWSGLAWVISTQFKNRIVMVGAAGIILLFGFSPQIADWDSILSSESLSVSLFMIFFAILIWQAFAYYYDSANGLTRSAGLISLILAVFLWVFVRDVNTYALIIPISMTLGLYILPRFRRSASLLITSALMFIILVLGITSARQRPLWRLALEHVFDSDIFTSPGIVEHFSERGMPDPGAPEYAAWFNNHAAAAYMKFLLTHPAYTTNKFFKDLNLAFTENMQPYFRANELSKRPLFIRVGEYLHPESGSVFLVSMILLVIIWNRAIFQRDADSLPWAWITTCMFLMAAVIMFFSIFGDTFALARHALSSTTAFRLLTWILLLVLVDFSLPCPDKPAMRKEAAPQAG